MIVRSTTGHSLQEFQPPQKFLREIVCFYPITAYRDGSVTGGNLTDRAVSEDHGSVFVDAISFFQGIVCLHGENRL